MGGQSLYVYRVESIFAGDQGQVRLARIRSDADQRWPWKGDRPSCRTGGRARDENRGCMAVPTDYDRLGARGRVSGPNQARTVLRSCLGAEAVTRKWEHLRPSAAGHVQVGGGTLGYGAGRRLASDDNGGTDDGQDDCDQGERWPTIRVLGASSAADVLHPGDASR
jgi:hypothetical protein